MLKRVVFGTAISISMILATSCERSSNTQSKADPPKAVTVAVAKAKPANLTRTMVLAAEFRPFQEVDVHAKVAGYVKHIYVDVGDHVKEGQLLAVLEIPELADELTRDEAATKLAAAELKRAQDELASAESAHGVAHLTYNRLAGVMKTRPNLVAQQEVDVAQGKDRESEAQVSAAQAALAAAEQQAAVSKADLDRVRTMYDYARITAPFTGVITKRYADTGSMIQAGTASQTQTMPLVRLAENGLLRLVLPVPESAVPLVHIGAAVEVRVPTLKRSFPGTVSRFADQVAEATRTMHTEVDVPNPNLLLVPGMYAEAVLTLDQAKNALSVPVQAIADPNHPSVLVVNTQDTLEERPVTIGISTPDRVQILSGIQKNDLVVVGNRSQYRAGESVQPKLTEMAAVQGEQ